jgi:O-antigen/teichoic acid export membrane protein
VARGSGEDKPTDQWLPAAHGSDEGSLESRVTRGISWTFLDQWGRQLLNLVVFIVIARLVEAEDIGLVALATVFVAFAQIFVDAGMADALVQRKVLTRAHIDTAFWTSLGTGLVLAAAGIALAIPIGILTGEPRVTPILQVLSLSFVLYGLSTVQMALLRRELALRSLALRAMLAVGGGSLVGVSLALLGFGAWALVGQQLSIATLSVLTLWRVSPWRPGRQFSTAHFRELFSFGVNIVGGSILTFFSRRTDNLLIGVFINATQLGFYAVAYRILDSAQALLSGVAGRVAFPAFSQLQHEPERLRNAFLRVSRITSALVMPGFLGLALVAPELIVVVFGRRWEESGPVAAVLFLIGIVWSFSNWIGAAINGAGHPEVTFRFRLISTVVNVIGFFIAAVLFQSIVAVAIAFVLRGYLLLPLHVHWLRRYVGVPVRSLVGQLRGVMLASLATAVAVLAVKFTIATDVHPAVLLGTETIAGGLVYLVTFWLVDRRLLTEMVSVARQAVPERSGRRRRRKDQPALNPGLHGAAGRLDDG